MAALFGFKPCGMSIDVLGDYELKNCRIETLMKAIRTEIVLLRIYSSKDLFFGKVHINKKFQYRVEAYNPQFGSRQFRLVQAIPELSNSSVNKGSSWRDMSMTPSEVKATPLYLSLQRLPFCSVDDKIGRSVYDEEVKASSEDGGDRETVLGEPSGPEETGPDPNSTLESASNPVRIRHLAGAGHT
ncbi:hypothetical protein GBA52_010441 [Prunus armeniaca]|nr:hypothetical protein GBA52_010441 [Prunus armeniaca]